MPLLPGNFVLQIDIDNLHHQTLEWLSTTGLWTRETMFFQKLLDTYHSKFTSPADKQHLENLQKFISYYSSDLVNNYRQLLLHHEGKLAGLFRERKEADMVYLHEHRALINDLTAFSTRYRQFKNELFAMIEKIM